MSSSVIPYFSQRSLSMTMSSFMMILLVECTMKIYGTGLFTRVSWQQKKPRRCERLEQILINNWE